MRHIVNTVHENTIRFNARFAGGYAKHDIANSLNYINNILKCAGQAFPEGLVYDGISVCTAEETYNVFLEKAQKNDRKYTYDHARTDVYLTRINLTFKGTALPPLYLNLPFTDQHGVHVIRDRAFHIKPVVADPLISINAGGLFLQLNQTKMTTYGRPHYIFKDDKIIRVKVISTTLHHSLRAVQNTEVKSSRSRITSNVHYLFAKEGYKEAFSKYFNATVEAGFADKINRKNYPEDEWVIYSSHNDPDLVQLTGHSERMPNKVLLAVKRKNVNKFVESAVGGFMFCLDVFPEVEDPDYLNDTAFWTIMLGTIIMDVGIDHRILMKKMGLHFNTLDHYIDHMAINLMKENDIYVDDIYDYLAWLVFNFDDYINAREGRGSSLYGKFFMVNRYIFINIRESIFNAIYELRQKDPSKLNPRVIHTVMSSRIKPDLITRINNNFDNVSAIISASDSRLLKTGMEVVPQDNFRKKKQSKNSDQLNNPNWKFDTSFIDAGSAFSMSKTEPIGRDGGNPNINLSENGQIRRQEKFKDVLEDVDEKTRRSE